LRVQDHEEDQRGPGERLSKRIVTPFCISIPNFIEISQTIVEILRFLVIFKIAAAAILDLQKFKILAVDPVPAANMHHCAKFHQDRSNGCRYMVIICSYMFFFKMAAVRHLLFVGRLLGPPTMTTWWSLSLHQISNSYLCVFMNDKVSVIFNCNCFPRMKYFSRLGPL